MELVATLSEKYPLNDELIGQIGDILFEIAELEPDNYPAHIIYQKCLVIYQHLEEEADIFSIDRHYKINMILAEKLNQSG